MENWTSRKDELIENLLEKSATVLDALDHGNFDGIDAFLEERARILRELERVDDHLRGQATARDEFWYREILRLFELDESIRTRLRSEIQGTAREIARTVQDRVDFIAKEILPSRGQNIETKA